MNNNDKEKRNSIWESHYGNQKTATDPFGRRMSSQTFHVDHIYPESKGGSNAMSNLRPLAPKSNLEKSDNLRGVVNGKSYTVTKATNSGSKKIGKLNVR